MYVEQIFTVNQKTTKSLICLCMTLIVLQPFIKKSDHQGSLLFFSFSLETH